MQGMGKRNGRGSWSTVLDRSNLARGKKKAVKKKNSRGVTKGRKKLPGQISAGKENVDETEKEFREARGRQCAKKKEVETGRRSGGGKSGKPKGRLCGRSETGLAGQSRKESEGGGSEVGYRPLKAATLPEDVLIPEKESWRCRLL